MLALRPRDDGARFSALDVASYYATDGWRGWRRVRRSRSEYFCACPTILPW